MTRKDYVMIADVLNIALRASGPNVDRATVRAIADTLAHRIQASYPEFNLSRFMAAVEKGA